MTNKEKWMALSYVVGQDGAILSTRPEDRRKLQEALRRVWMFEPLFRKYVAFVAPYRMSEQKKPGFRKCDGVAPYKIYKDPGSSTTHRAQAILISVEALDQGKDYATMILLHELSHCISGADHGQHFNGVMDELVSAYNRKTGSHVINDYENVQ